MIYSLNPFDICVNDATCLSFWLCPLSHWCLRLVLRLSSIVPVTFLALALALALVLVLLVLLQLELVKAA